MKTPAIPAESQAASPDLVFIDANVYLTFYRSLNPKEADLLPAIRGLQGSLLVTTQVRDEVIRNRAKVLTELLDSIISNFKIPCTTLPKTLVGDCSSEIEAWNRDCESMSDNRSGLVNRLKNLRDKIVDHVVAGSDNISSQLQSIFANSVEPTSEQVRRARDRKERGNPPGKFSDPLGDQLSWEQLLDRSKGHQRLWLISKDFDYFVPLEKDSVELSPFLMNELKPLVPEIRCFNDLRTSIEEFRKESGDRGPAIPSAEELPKAPPSITQYHQNSAPSGVLEFVIPEVMDVVPTRCPGCGGTLFGQSQINPGRARWNLKCAQCGRGFIQL